MAKAKETAKEKAERLAGMARTYDALQRIIEDEVHLVIVNLLEDYRLEQIVTPADFESFARDRAKRLTRSHCGFHTGVGGRATYLKALRGFWHEARFNIQVENSEQLTLVSPPDTAA